MVVFYHVKPSLKLNAVPANKNMINKKNPCVWQMIMAEHNVIPMLKNTIQAQ